MEGGKCADDIVCMTVQSSVNLGTWIHDVYTYHDDVAHCPGVKEVAPLMDSVVHKFGGGSGQ